MEIQAAVGIHLSRRCPLTRILPHMAAPRYPPAGPVCFVFWADRGPGASCPYGEGPRRALVTFPRWKVTQGQGGRSTPKLPAGAFRGQPPQAALGPRGRSTPGKPASAALGPGWRSAPKLSAGSLRRKPAAGGSWAGIAQRPATVSYCPAPPDFFAPPLHFPAGCGKLNALKFVGVAKLADAADLKSADGNIVPVRSRSPAP